MDFTAYTAKLEPFLLMSKSAKGAAAAKLVRDATGAQGVYVFAQLLDVPNIREVRSIPIGSDLVYLWPCPRFTVAKDARPRAILCAFGAVCPWNLSGLQMYAMLSIP